MVSGREISLKIYNSQFHVDLFINNPVSVDYHVPYGELKYALFLVLVIQVSPASPKYCSVHSVGQDCCILNTFRDCSYSSHQGDPVLHFCILVTPAFKKE